MTEKNRRCSLGIWDESVAGISFNDKGISNYAEIFQNLEREYPKGDKGKRDWHQIINNIKDTKKNQYDCLIGVSGGVDSSYLLYLAKEKYGLNPLAFTFDNGWSSDIAVKNIYKMTSKLGIDLETYVVDYEEMKNIHKAYIRSRLPWIDMPTDFAIRSVLYKIAKRENIKNVLIGHDFRTEGTQPNEWSHGDSRQLKYIVKKFSSKKIKFKSYPIMPTWKMFYYSQIHKIKIIKPFYYFDYDKKSARIFLEKKFDWKYYGEHHHENLFTKFAISDWLFNKFNIDKRIVTYSAQVLSKYIERDEAIEKVSKKPYKDSELLSDRDYVLKKLGMSENEFESIYNSENHSIYDYPSYLNLLSIIAPIVKFILPQKPSFLFQYEKRVKNKK
tara:strand:+ start:138 stop:1295 length:1158 start_codon:yes stop_codon:yes gene_type:complete